MSTTGKKKKYHFTFQTFLRLVIFSLLIYFLIGFLSQNKSNLTYPSILGEQIASSSALPQINIDNLYDKIPSKSRPALQFIEEKYQQILKLSEGFPQKQIKEIKKALLKNAYDDILKNIEQQ